METISLCLTTMNRFEMTVRSFEQVIDDPRLSEIIISDDASTDDSFSRLQERFKNKPKIKLFQNPANVNMSRNKALAIERANNQWVIIFDSDNELSPSYIDALEKQFPWNEETIYQPSYARERFDFRQWQNIKITRKNVVEFMEHGMFRVSLNAHNFFVNRERYLDNYDYDPTILGADSIYFLHRWLKNGGTFLITENLEYIHAIHDSSGYMENVNINMAHSKKYEDLIRELR